MEVAEAKKQLEEAANLLYSSENREIDPLFPWVLVQILPKEQKYKGVLILPDFSGKDKAQNKPMYEGIVLKTWKPFWRHFKTNHMPDNEQSCAETRETEIWVESQLQPGDHILFPHWSGQPAGFLDEKEFRLIQEISDYDPPPIPPAKIEYEQESVSTRLQNLVEDFVGVAGLDIHRTPKLVQAIANRIMGEFYVISKKMSAKTISGL